MNISITSVNWTWCSTSIRWAPGEEEEEGARGGGQWGARIPQPPWCLRWGLFAGSWASELPSSPGVPPTAHPRVSPRPPFPQVYTVVDEMFLAGEIRETSQTKVLKQLLMLQSLE